MERSLRLWSLRILEPAWQERLRPAGQRSWPRWYLGVAALAFETGLPAAVLAGSGSGAPTQWAAQRDRQYPRPVDSPSQQ